MCKERMGQTLVALSFCVVALCAVFIWFCLIIFCQFFPYSSRYFFLLSFFLDAPAISFVVIVLFVLRS